MSTLILHHVGGVSLLFVKDHELLVDLMWPVVPFDVARAYHDGVVQRAAAVAPNRWPLVPFPHFACMIRITKHHTGEDQGPFTFARTGSILKLM